MGDPRHHPFLGSGPGRRLNFQRYSMPLSTERETSGLDPDIVAVALYGSSQAVVDRRRLAALWYSDHVVRGLPKSASPFLSRTALFERGLRLSRRMVELRTIHGLSDEEVELLKVRRSRCHKSALIKPSVMQSVASEQSPFILTDSVFIPALEHIATPEQQEEGDILKRARSWAVSGAFAQTELGHGSAVRGLETTATYVPEEDVFRVDSPVRSATKWWPGALGLTATHAVIAAQLVMDDGTRQGIHMLLARIREPDGCGGWRLVPNVTAGEIGPKFGYSAVDNGWARFSGLRIPRAGLLAAAGRVERVQGSDGRWRGAYVPAEGAAMGRAMYKSLVATRIQIACFSYDALSQAVTIAVRYAAQRAQFAPPGAQQGTPETLLLDYPVHQRRLMPALATAFAMTVLEDATPVLLEEALTSAASPVAGAKAVHVVSAALKVFVTDTVSNFVEECRRACGGHGYSLASGLPQIFATYVHLVTAEGDNTVMVQQVARGLVSADWKPDGFAADDAWDANLLVFTEATAPRGGAACWKGVHRLLQV